MTSDILYFDNNATTRIDPRVFEAMRPWLTEHYGNPSSVYKIGRKAHAAIEVARRQVADALGSRESEIIFTSCGTESINTAILSACALDPDRKRIITSAVEHSATLKLCDYLATRGYEIIRLRVNSEGLLDLNELADAINDDTAVVSLLWANNETGVLFPVTEIAVLCNQKGVALHLDAVQAFGKLPIAEGVLDASFISFSGHKIHAPKGVGALYVNRRVRFTPLLRGSQEKNRRGGTENVASIVGMGAAAALSRELTAIEGTKVKELRDRFENAILQNVPDCAVNGHRMLRLPNTSNISFAGIESEGALLLLDERGVCCSAGSACTSGSVAPSHVLTAMGVSAERARASLRFSFGRFNTVEEIDVGVNHVIEVIQKLRAESPVVSISDPVRFAGSGT
jgi:cysteine desulfurase